MSYYIEDKERDLRRGYRQTVTNAELESLKAEYRNMLRIAELAKQEAEQAKAESDNAAIGFAKAAVALEGVAQESTVTQKVNALQQDTEQLLLYVSKMYETLNGHLHAQEEVKEEDVLKLFEHITVKHQVAEDDEKNMKLVVYRSKVDDVLLESEDYNQSGDLWVFCWKSTTGEKIYSLSESVATGERVYSEQEVKAALDYNMGGSRETYLQEHTDGIGEWIAIDD